MISRHGGGSIILTNSLIWFDLINQRFKRIGGCLVVIVWYTLLHSTPLVLRSSRRRNRVSYGDINKSGEGGEKMALRRMGTAI